jgi:Tol biopolymer transport system component
LGNKNQSSSSFPQSVVETLRSGYSHSSSAAAMNPDGSDVTKVANNEGRATAPQWTKDGKNIFFPLCKKVDFSADCQIYTVKLDAFAK